MKLVNWKYLKSGLSGLAAIAGFGMLSYAPACSAEAITGTWGAGTSLNATGKSASLALFSTVGSDGLTTTNPFSEYSRVEVWAFRSPFGGYPQGGNMLLRWDPTMGGDKTPSLALPALPDGSYYLAVVGYVIHTLSGAITNLPTIPPCRWQNNDLTNWTSGDTRYCDFAVSLFDNLIGSLNCSSGSCTTSTSEPVSSIVPQTGGWWNPSESGRGFRIEASNGSLVFVVYGYDANGTATWYLASGPLTDDGSFTGQLRQYAGGQTLTGPYVEPAIVNGNVGTISIKFSDSTNGILTQPDGRQIPITRFRF